MRASALQKDGHGGALWKEGETPHNEHFFLHTAATNTVFRVSLGKAMKATQCTSFYNFNEVFLKEKERKLSMYHFPQEN